MKVLYVSAKYGLHDHRFLKKLSEDYDVLFLHYCSNKQIPQEIQELKNIKIIARKPFIKSFPLANIFGFRKICKSFKPDIIHTGYIWQVGVLPAFLNFHPHLSMPWGSDILTEPDKNPLIKMLVKKVMRSCDHVQCDANHVKNKIVSDYKVPPEKITVFPWGIELNLFSERDKTETRLKLGLEENYFTVLFSRPLEDIYDIPVLMKGLELFCAGKNDVKIIITHSGQRLSYVKSFIKDRSLEKHFLVTGWIKHEEIPDWYYTSDVFVSTALSDGTPLSLLEAMACGLGLAVTNLPSIMEWVGEDNGLIFPVGDSLSLANSLNTYYKDRGLLKMHGEKNKQIVKSRADWDKNYSILKNIYGSLIR